MVNVSRLLIGTLLWFGVACIVHAQCDIATEADVSLIAAMGRSTLAAGGTTQLAQGDSVRRTGARRFRSLPPQMVASSIWERERRIQIHCTAPYAR